MSDSIRLADYILIPLKPSQLDIWACQDSIELVQARMMVDDKLKAGLVLSQVNKQTNLTKDVSEFIKDKFTIPLLPYSTGIRVSYAEVLSLGGTVLRGSQKRQKKKLHKLQKKF